MCIEEDKSCLLYPPKQNALTSL